MTFMPRSTTVISLLDFRGVVFFVVVVSYLCTIPEKGILCGPEISKHTEVHVGDHIKYIWYINDQRDELSRIYEN